MVNYPPPDDQRQLVCNFFNTRNVGKYVMHTKDLIKFEVIPRFHFSRLEITQLPLLERFIIARAHSVSIDVTNALNEYKFAEASRDITDFVWNELADWFIEASKSRLKPGLLSSKDTSLSDICSGPENSTNFSGVSLSVLLYVWQLSLKLLHPFMPFVTESLWQMLSDSEADSLMISEWPVVKGKDDLYVDKEAIADFEILKSIVKAIRNTRTEYAVSPSKRIAATINVQSHRLSESLQTEILSLSFLGRLDSSSIQFVNLPERVISDEIDKTFVQLVISEGVIVFLPISDLVDVEKETARLQRQIEKIGAETAILQNRLQAKKFVDRAKPEVVAATRAQLLEKEDVLSALHASLARLSISKSY